VRQTVTLRRVLNFNHLYYFHIVALEGSVKAAAERLGITQPTVSEQIRMLERSLSVHLFERTTTGLRLTQAGRDAFEHTSAMFIAGERLISALGRDSAERHVKLRVGVSSAVSRTSAADFLMPVLSVDQCMPFVRTGDFNDLLRDLRAHELDLVVGETEPILAARPGIEAVLIHRPNLVAVCHPRLEPSKNWENLALLAYRGSSAYQWEVENFLRQQGLTPVSAGEFDDAFLMLEAVCRGGFVAFVPESVARSAVDLARVNVLTRFQPTGAGVYALYPNTGTANFARAAVDRLIESA